MVQRLLRVRRERELATLDSVVPKVPLFCAVNCCAVFQAPPIPDAVIREISHSRSRFTKM